MLSRCGEKVSEQKVAPNLKFTRDFLQTMFRDSVSANIFAHNITLYLRRSTFALFRGADTMLVTILEL